MYLMCLFAFLSPGLKLAWYGGTYDYKCLTDGRMLGHLCNQSRIKNGPYLSS